MRTVARVVKWKDSYAQKGCPFPFDTYWDAEKTVHQETRCGHPHAVMGYCCTRKGCLLREKAVLVKLEEEADAAQN